MKSHKQEGFTLLELLIVVVIIGILAAIALPGYMRTREKAKVSEAKQILSAIRQSEIRYFGERDGYAICPTLLATDPSIDIDVPGACSAPVGGWTYTVAAALTTCTATATRSSSPGGTYDTNTVILDCTTAVPAGNPWTGTHPLR